MVWDGTSSELPVTPRPSRVASGKSALIGPMGPQKPHPPLLLLLLLVLSSRSCIALDKAVLLTSGALHAPSAAANLPVVMWHGMGDSCCGQYSIGALKRMIEKSLGVYVLSIATGDSEAADVWSSYFGDLNTQVARACETIQSTPQLQGGYNAIGFSQGGQFMRAVVQRCNHMGPAKAKQLITLGAQHQGVQNIPHCSVTATVNQLPPGGIGGQACLAMQALLSRGAYLPIIQSHVVQAQYFKDPHHLDAYLKYGIFLPDINNELKDKKQQYKANLAGLDKFVMYRFADDDTVVPRDSSWFSFYNGTTLLSLQQQALYQEDWLGLKQLDETGRLVFAEAPGLHMHFSFAWFEQEVITKYLSNGRPLQASLLR